MLLEIDKSEASKIQELQLLLKEYDCTAEDLLDFMLVQKTKGEGFIDLEDYVCE